jgi:hypothetical protein
VTGGSVLSADLESREYLVDLYRSAWAQSGAAIADLPLDAPDKDSMGDASTWSAYVATIQAAADQYR